MPEKFMSKEAVVLGFDYGLKRIGVAIANTITREARPLQIISWRTNGEKWDPIAKIIKDWTPACAIVGVPFHKDGNPNSMTEVCRKFGRQLEGRFKLKVFYADERFSSVESEALSSEEFIDDEAAAVILQQWLNTENE